MASSPTIYNLTLTNANTEYSQAFARSKLQAIEIKCRTLADLKVAFISGNSGTTYWTVPAGSSEFWSFGVYGVLTVYIQSPTAGSVAEIITWE